MKLRYILIFVLIIIISLNIVSFVAATEKDSAKYIEYTVVTGDTIWYIAKNNNYIKKDIREVVWEIQKINNVEDSLIYPGQTLKIPLK